MKYAKAPNTVRAYAHSWKVFSRWCNLAQLTALPAEPETVSLFITWAMKYRKPAPYSVRNIQHIVAAVKDRHRSEELPIPNNEIVRKTLSGAARSVKRVRRGKDALSDEQLSMMCDLLGQTAREIRDKAILTVGFATSWRRSELASLTTEDVEFLPEGMLVRLGRSKTDQEGKGREARIPYAKIQPELCAVTALREWLDVRGRWSGPLFTPFTGRGTPKRKHCDPKLIAITVKRSLRVANIDPARYAAHSLRSGMVTEASASGADPFAIAQRTGHRDMDTLFSYVQEKRGFGNDPLGRVI